MQTLGLYLHIPFCEKRCNYCAFLTFDNQDKLRQRYVDYLKREIALHQDEKRLVDTVYFGGGTPSYLSAQQMTELMDSVKRCFTVAEDAEITIEMNPESVTREHLEAYLKSGINRFSMGVQSFDDQVLKKMGRLHNKQTVFEKVALMKEMGCHNFSLDLMFSNPYQSMDVWEKDIANVIALKPKHLSCYSLMYKPHTNFYKWRESGKITMVDDETDRKMYHLLQKELQKAGYHQYEISSFALPHYEGKHNKKYWTQKDYLGLGLGASSNIRLKRFDNVDNFIAYFQAIDAGQLPIAADSVMELSLEEKEQEYIILNMRLIEGLSIEEVNRKFGIDFLKKYDYAVQKHLKTGLLQLQDGRLKFTQLGLDVGNQFYLDII